MHRYAMKVRGASWRAWLAGAILLLGPALAWGYAEFTIDGAGNEGAPAAAFSTSAGKFLVVWESDAAGRREIMGQFFDLDGQGLDQPFPIGVSAFDSYAPDVVYDHQADRFFVSWLYDYHGDGRDIDIRGRIVPAAGLDPALPARDLVATTSSQTQPDVGLWDSSGSGSRFLVVWHDDADGSLRGRTIATDGVPAGTETVIVAPPPGATVEDPQLPDHYHEPSSSPALMTYTERDAGGLGNIYAAWLLTPPDGLSTTIALVDARFPIAAYSGNEEEADVTYTGYRKWLVSWLGGAGTTEPYARGVNPNGSLDPIVQPMGQGFSAASAPAPASSEWMAVVFHAFFWKANADWFSMRTDTTYGGGEEILPSYSLLAPPVSVQAQPEGLRLAVSSNQDRGVAMGVWQQQDIATGAGQVAGFVKDIRIPSSERAALMELHASTGGPGWQSGHWGAVPGTECEWYGITCHAGEHRVAWIELPSNGLAGTLPASLGSLTGLTVLWLAQNDLTGTIPASLLGLPMLKQLSLGSNRLTGPIPSPSPGQWPALELLELGFNELSGNIPASLTGLPELEGLYVISNDFDGPLPDPAAGEWQFLAEFSASNNRLSGSIPAGFRRLPRLFDIDLANNDLSGPLPVQAPEDWPAVAGIDLSGNRFDGPIADELASRDLWHLSLSDNELSGPLPHGLVTMDNLGGLLLANNRLTGELPRPMPSQWAGLRALVLSNNRFTGTIPPELDQLPVFVNIDLAGNALEGNIPPELLSLTNASFDFRFNALQTDDPAVQAHVSQGHGTATWIDSQTVPPTNVRLEERTDRGAVVAWDPAANPLGLPGRYRVWYRFVGEPWTAAGETGSKASTRFPIVGLVPSSVYQFAVTTITDPHAANANSLQSAYSDFFMDATRAACAEPPAITATSGQPDTLLEVAAGYTSYRWSTGGTQPFETVPSSLDDWVYLVAETTSGCSTMSAIYVPVDFVFSSGFEG